MLAVDASALSEATLADAVAILRSGGLVAFPTESFYGLGAEASNPRALASVFGVKGRPERKPLLVLVDSVAMAETLAAESRRARAPSVARHWPGALTSCSRPPPTCRRRSRGTRAPSG
jgi:L-threonylcarbamoyladenylate synthase